MTTGGDKGGSSTNTIEESPRRRRSGGANPPPASPPRQWPPVMGIPGVSAFRPYIRPPPPPTPPSNPSWLAPRPTGGAGGNIFGFSSGGLGFVGAQAIPVGGGNTGGSRAVGGSPSSAAKKRGRDGAAGGGGGGGGGGAHVEAGGNPVNCSVCGKEFMSPKALFGHMRSHPGRGWKGAHPPPSFKAEEEFADLRGVNLHPAGGAAAAAPAPAPAAVEDGGADSTPRADGEQRGAAEEGGQQPKYRLPDLNEG